ncbi:MAG TPA: hypothetical protein VLE27_10785 [Thermoanaerobaculia bacterium]|nr:hypothetical protein [Thermoanaerobaculia bacterium]
MENPEMEELLKVTKEGFAGLYARVDSLQSDVDSLHAAVAPLQSGFDSLHAAVGPLQSGFDSLHAVVGPLQSGFDSLHARFDAFGEGLLFVARKVLAEPEVRELRKILEGNATAARRSA